MDILPSIGNFNDVLSTLLILCMLVQQYQYMAARGHVAGGVSTFYHTWAVQVDENGEIKISEPIRYDAAGTNTTVSVTEVSRHSITQGPYAPQEPRHLSSFLLSNTC